MAVGDEDCRRTMEAMLHVTKTNGVLHRSDPRFCCIAVGPECGTGVDRISVGALTHSAVALDVALDWDAE